MQIVNIRCSRLPLVDACGQSIKTDDLPKIDSSSAPSRVGSAIHLGVGNYIQEIPNDFPAIAQQHGIIEKSDFNDLIKFTNFGIVAWNDSLSQYFPSPRVEESMAWIIERKHITIHLTGTIDLYSLLNDPDHANLLDWKSGRIRTAPKAQVLGYGYLIHRNFKINNITALVFWIRDFESDPPYKFNTKDFQEFEERLVEIASNPNPEYCENEHCVFCPRYTTCPAVQNKLIQLRQTLIKGGIGALNLSAMTPDELHEINNRRKLLESLCEKLKNAFNAELDYRGEAILSDGRRMYREELTKQGIDASKAVAVLKSDLGMTDEEIFDICKLTVTDLKAVAQNRAPKGTTKKAAAARLILALDEAGAIEETKYKRFTVD